MTEAVRAVFAEPRISGIALWQMLDTRSFGPAGEGTDIRGKPRGYNCAGVLDEYRRPKLSAMAVGSLFAKL
jgi:beta-glucuronidase